MRILVLCYEYPPLGGGGGRIARAVAERLAARGHTVQVQTAGMPHLPQRAVEGGVEVFRTLHFRQKEEACAVHEMGLYVAKSVAPALRRIREFQPDVMHVHFAMPTGLLAWMLHGLTRVPYLLTAHLGDVPGAMPEQTSLLFTVANPVAKRVWKQAAGATAVSSFVRDLAVAAYQRPVETVLNGIDLSERPSRPERVNTPPRLVFVGRFNPQKNAPLLIEALSGLQHLDWRLTMIGDGVDMPAVRAGIARAGLATRIELAGWLGADEVHRRLAESDILCLPSSVEGMPVAGIEALRAGLAIASTTIPGMRDVATDAIEGVLALPNDAEAYRNALARLLTDHEFLLRGRQASWDKAQRFDIETIAAQYEQALQSATAT